jgi:membrane-associated phospholipid phosphatase
MTVVSCLYWDINLTTYCQTLSPTIKNIAEVITTFGIATWYIVVSFILYLFFRFIYKNKLNASRSIFVFLSLSITGIFITLLKWIAGRHRPVDLFTHGYSGFDYFGVGYGLTSFPSGHAQTAFTLATALTILFPRWGIPLFVFAGTVSISRIILTSHYLSDVMAGAGVGILCTLAVKYLFDRKQIKLTGK